MKSKYHELISNVFSDLLRNSIDHGLEKPDVRKAAGRDEAGYLHFDISSRYDSLKIVYYDDGDDLNLPKIYEKARSKGIASDDVHMRTESIANLMLSAFFSTAEKVSDISGRRVGMDAVKAYVKEENGVLELTIDDPDRREIKPVRAIFAITLPGGQFESMI